jgi:hypothetical protein
MQVIDSQSSSYRTVRSSLQTIIKNEGWYGLYRGLVPSVIASTGSWGGYFFLYNQFKALNIRKDGLPAQFSDNVYIYFIKILFKFLFLTLFCISFYLRLKQDFVSY